MIRVMTEKGLSGNALKVIAIVAMTIDHLAWVGIETYEQAETPTQIFLHCIGRLTAPMMIFFVAEGYHHTHDFRRYLRRLIMLCLTRLPFLQEAFQEESEEIGECVELPIPSDILIAEFDAVLHIRIGIPLNKVVQRGGGVILGLHFNRYQ